MKRVNNIYNKICDINVIMDMYDKVIKVNTKNKKKIQNFENFYSCNIAKIKETLITKKYVPGKYNIFLVNEPKTRIIMSQEIEDKIVNYYYNYFKNKYGKFYILKMDISKYFYNLDHEIIKQLVRNKIKDKNVLKIVDSIIDLTDEEYINKEIIKLKNNEKQRILESNYKDKNKRIQEIDQLPLYQQGKGVCIGNMVSQIVATFYFEYNNKLITQEKYLGVRNSYRGHLSYGKCYKLYNKYAIINC